MVALHLKNVCNDVFRDINIGLCKWRNELLDAHKPRADGKLMS